MYDFSHKMYEQLILELKKKQYNFYTFEEYSTCTTLQYPFVILRHDVDRMPKRAVDIAKIENKHNVKSTFFFRHKPISFRKEMITDIALLKHEIGYHYEELSDSGGDFDVAFKSFKNNLKVLRQLYPVTSIAMHGRPFSKWDNRTLWNNYSYKDVGILTEAYQDIEWDDLCYFTDVGRCWNSQYNKRDKVESLENISNDDIETTGDLIKLIRKDKINLVISTHPERWTSKPVQWICVAFQDRIINYIKLVMKILKK